MRNPCTAKVKNKKLRARIPCGRSGRFCRVLGASFEVRLVLCSSHRKRESKRYGIEVVAREETRNRRATARLSDIERAVTVAETKAADFLEGL